MKKSLEQIIYDAVEMMSQYYGHSNSLKLGIKFSSRNLGNEKAGENCFEQVCLESSVRLSKGMNTTEDDKILEEAFQAIAVFKNLVYVEVARIHNGNRAFNSHENLAGDIEFYTSHDNNIIYQSVDLDDCIYFNLIY